MRTLDQWLTAYGVSHQNTTNRIIHKVCVPAIMFSLLGLLWCIPTPAFFSGVLLLNWSTLFVAFCLLFYLSLKSVKMFLGVFLLMLPMVLILNYWQSNIGLPLLQSSIFIFVVAWIGQFIGHKIEGAKPSFFEDLLFLLIGPLWVVHSFYLTLGISKLHQTNEGNE